MTRGTIVGGIAAVTLAAVISACGGSSSPTSPSGNGGGSNSGPGPVGATITITANGVSPSSVTLSVGQSVTVVNNDTRAHQISSDPHPSHTECPALNLASLSAGQSQTSNALTAARTCGFHDHLDPSSSRWQGQVTVR